MQLAIEHSNEAIAAADKEYAEVVESKSAIANKEYAELVKARSAIQSGDVGTIL